jgi:hypothetical protein
MALQTEFALINSEFNDFLFASVGEEKNGMTLTVLSAFTRLDVDPWGEAARLAGLPKEAAARALAAIIAALPEGDWKASEAGAIAVRLIDRLPRRVLPIALPLPRDLAPEHRTMATTAALWAFRIMIAGTVFLAIWHLQSLPSATPSSNTVSSPRHP